ncbi:MAG: lysoplasmalogenase [Chloroflexi bacterium]|jgi:uncharacterized membrane protein YhhN|nr:lysoplasmalogenase [Chloroflexota bacterium]
MTIPVTFLAAAMVIALIDWLAVAFQWKNVSYLVKPGVDLALLAWVWQAGGFQGPLVWFALGLLFSLAGDIFLMLPQERFTTGLAAFLLAHLSYIIGFNQTPPPVDLASLLVVLLVAVTAWQFTRRVLKSIKATGKGEMTALIIFYSIALNLMLISALLTLVRSDIPAEGGWLVGPALMVSAGALLFYLSDALLAWNRFVSPLPHGRLQVRVTYHIGQALITAGAVLQFLLPLSS